jgi:hypothetical protein
VDRKSDAESDAITRVAAAALLGPEPLVSGRLERPIEGALVVTDVVRRARRRGEEERVGGHEIAAPDLGRVGADLGGEAVDGALDGGGRPAPRYATVGVVFVTTDRDANSARGMRYTPVSMVRVMNGSTAPMRG